METLSGQVSEDEKPTMRKRMPIDQQKTQLTTRSTTTTRLSQRLLVSQAARKKGKTIESWDIAGAFLKGFDFKSIQKALQKMGLSAPTRQVVIYPPMNV